MQPLIKVLSRFVFLFAVVLVFATGCATRLPPNSLATHNASQWTNEIAAIEARDATNPPPAPPIIFVGSSSIRRWSTLAADFPGLPVLNHGFGGSFLVDSAIFADRIIIPQQPRQVVIYAGGNDLNAHLPPEIVYGDFVALVTRIHSALPHARISFIASAPNPQRWAQVENVRKLNELVAAYCRRHGIDFINVFPLMLGADSHPLPDIYVEDGLHMNAKGYAIWKAAVAPYLH